MKKHLILIIPYLFLLSGCAIFSSTITFTPVDGLGDVKISSRTAPAKISKESDKALKSQGYAHIGFVRSEDVVKTCWGDDCRNFTCSDTLPHRDTTKEVLEKAAVQGGDLVLLHTDSVRAENSTTKTGKCTGGYSTSYTEQECSGGYGKVARVCQNVTKRRYTCTSWQTDYGRKCTFVSAGTVWRHDPELIKVLAKIEREKKFPSKFEVMKKTHEANLPKVIKGRISIAGPCPMQIDNKYGFQESLFSKKIIIAPQYTAVNRFSEDVASVAIGEKDEKLWGFIDKTGKWVIRPLYHDASSFHEGLASVKMNTKYGYIDKKGDFIINPQFDEAYSFIEGIAKVKVGNKVGYVNKLGEVAMEP
jgi:hypothetical protein